MYEELITDDEHIKDSPHNKIMVLTNEISHGWNRILGQSEKIVEIANSYDAIKIKNSLKVMVPEYEQDDLNINLFNKKTKKRTYI